MYTHINSNAIKYVENILSRSHKLLLRLNLEKKSGGLVNFRRKGGPETVIFNFVRPNDVFDF